MKKLMSALGMLLIISLLFTCTGFAAEMEYDTFPDWELQVAVPDDTVAVLDGGSYYIYPEGDTVGGIPYVMIRTYSDYEDEYDFFYNYFTDYMKEQYSDLYILEDFSIIYMENREFYEIDYGYTVQGYDVIDRRVAKTIDGRTYVFATKEIPELGRELGTMLQVVCANCVFLRDGEPIDEAELGGDYPDDELPVVNWEFVSGDLEEEGIEGEFVTFDEVGYKMFLPDFLYPATLPADQTAQNTFIGFFTNAAQDAYVSVQFLPTTLTMDYYKEFLTSLGTVEDMADFLVNGEHFILYFMPEADIMCLTTHTGDGILEFTFFPDSNGDFSSMAEVMGASIQKVQ